MILEGGVVEALENKRQMDSIAMILGGLPHLSAVRESTQRSYTTSDHIVFIAAKLKWATCRLYSRRKTVEMEYAGDIVARV